MTRFKPRAASPKIIVGTAIALSQYSLSTSGAASASSAISTAATAFVRGTATVPARGTTAASWVSWFATRLEPLKLGEVFVSKPDLISAAIAGLLVVAIVLFFKHTKIGLGLRAIADDPAAAQVVGIPLHRVWAVAWALAGMVAIASGVLWGSRIGVHFAMSLIALKALPVLIIGGIDSVAGVIVAGLIVGAAEALGEGYIGTHIGGGVQDVMAYVVALLFLMFKPSGLFGQTVIQRL